MTVNQRQLVLSWFVLATMLIASLFIFGEQLYLILVLVAGIPLYKYLRRNLDRKPLRTFQVMGYKWQFFSVAYYFIVSGVTFTLAFLYPHKITYDTGQVVFFIGLLMVPIIPIAIGKEAELFRRMSRANEAPGTHAPTPKNRD